MRFLKLKSELIRQWAKLRYRLTYLADRSRFTIPEFAFDQDFKVQLACTQEDFEGAFRLLHDDYLQKKLGPAKEKGLLVHTHAVMPQTATVVVKYRDTVVATASLVQDSKIGFCSEKYFSSEIQNLRSRQKMLLIEMSSIAIDKGFKKQTLVLLHLLMKFTINYTKKHLNFDNLIMAVNPAIAPYFEDHWQLKSISPVVRYNSSAQSRLILMHLDLSLESHRFYRRLIPSKKIQENPALFIAKRDLRFHYPELPKGQILFPVMTPEMLNYFCLQTSRLYEEFDLLTRQFFLEMYIQFYGFEKMQGFLNIESEVRIKEYRLPIQTQVSVRSGEEYLRGLMRDLSSTGCFFELPGGLLRQHEKVHLTFKIGSLELNVHAQPIWRNRNQHVRYGEGYGVRFDNPLLQISEEMRTWSTRLHKNSRGYQ
jgi:hypothetical protein